MIILDFDPAVVSILEQPFSISYRAGAQTRRYTPDVLAEFQYDNGTNEVIVYEVKPSEELRAHWKKYRARFKAAIRHCRAKNWRFKLVTEKSIRTPLLDNAKFLRKYRRFQTDSVVCSQLLYTLQGLGPSTPQALLAAAYWDKATQVKALPMLWKMIAEGAIRADLSKTLTMSTPLLQAD